MMKKTIFFVLVLISNITFSKNHETFIGLKVSNGRTVFNYRYTYNGVKNNSKQKLFFSGVYFNYGGTIKNFTIYSGLSYNLYQFKYDNLVFDDNFNGTNFVPEKNPRQNYSLTTIPLNIDYNVNLYKQKLFFVVGLGGELAITIKSKFKSSDRTIPSDLSKQKIVSFAVSARTGLLYKINKRFDVYTYFDFSHHITKYLQNKTELYPGNATSSNYPFNVSGSVGFNVKLYKKAKESVQQK